MTRPSSREALAAAREPRNPLPEHQAMTCSYCTAEATGEHNGQPACADCLQLIRWELAEAEHERHLSNEAAIEIERGVVDGD